MAITEPASGPSRRRAELVDAAVAAIRDEGPHLSMEAMAARAGITKPILYRHFGDRAGLCAAIVERFAGEIERDLVAAFESTDSDEERLRLGVDAYLRFIERDPQVYRFLTQRAGPEVAAAQRAIDDFVRRVGDLVAHVIRARLEELGARTEVVEPSAHGLVGTVYAVGNWWIDHPERTRADVRESVVTLLWRGLAGVV